jgi:hypothetical protein
MANAYDTQTVALLSSVIDNVWNSLSIGDQERITKSLLAQRVLVVAAAGERNFKKLRDAALREDASLPNYIDL